MVFVRLILVVSLVVLASLSGAMETRHAIAMDVDHSFADDQIDDQLDCCNEGVERTHSCHSLPAVLSNAKAQDADGMCRANVFVSYELLLNGIEPSGLLDPPRLA